MINAGTVAAYLTLDTSDFTKGIAAAGQMLADFRNEQSDGFDGLGAMLGGLGSLILEKVGEMVGAVGSAGAFDTLPETLKGKGLLAAQSFMDGIGGLNGALSGFGAAMLRRFNGMVGALGDSAALAALPQTLRDRGTLAAQGFMGGIGGLLTAVGEFGASLLGRFDGAVGAIGGSEALTALPATLRSRGALAMEGLIGGMVSRGGAASSSMKNIMGSVKSAAGAVSFVSVGSNIISGVMSGMNGRRAALMAAAGNIAASVSGVMRSALKINSPSRVMMEIGEFTAQGMELGLAKGAESLYGTASAISKGTADALSGVISAAGGSAGGGADYGSAYTSEGDRLGRLIDAVERLAAAQSTVEIDGRPFGRLVREYL